MLQYAVRGVSMRSLSGVAAISAFLGVVLIGHWAIIVALRFFRINVPFSLPFHFYTRRERELLVALKGRPMELYVFISGVLLFACPLFAGITTYDYIVRRYIEHSTFDLNYFTGSAVIFVVVTICGIWKSIVDWKKFTGVPRNSA